MSEQTVAVNIAPEAAARVRELGFQREFEQMLEHARQVGGLLGVRVTLEYDPDCPHRDPQVVIWVHRAVPPEGPAADRTNWDLTDWRIGTFPPEPCVHISMIAVYGAPDER
jgi:hypothetical protein